MICHVTGLRRASRYLVSMASTICCMKVLSRRRVSNFFLLNKMILCACELGGRAVRFWDEVAWIRRPGEGVVRQDTFVFCGCEDHAHIAMIAASQGGWYLTCVCF